MLCDFLHPRQLTDSQLRRAIWPENKSHVIARASSRTRWWSIGSSTVSGPENRASCGSDHIGRLLRVEYGTRQVGYITFLIEKCDLENAKAGILALPTEIQILCALGQWQTANSQ